MQICTDWKAAVVLVLSLAVLGIGACGGGGGTTSGLSVRAFVSDDIDSTLHIEDAQHDAESGSRITTGSRPGTLALSPDKSIILVFDSGDQSLAVVANASETVLGRITLPANICPATPPAPCMGYVALSDNTVGFVAVPNCPPASCNGNVGVTNVVDVVDLKTTFNVTGTVPVANIARTLVLSPTEAKLLVFSAAADHQDSLTVIDTATAKGATPSNAATSLGSADCLNASLPANCFDRPTEAVFSSDGSTAYVFNCGPECGGATASLTVLNVAANPPAPTKYIPFPATAGATVGLLNGNKLFVAGTPSGNSGKLAGTLVVLDITALAPPAAPVPISDGFHNHMELASNNQLFIGANTCSSGCLTMFDTSKNTAVVDSSTGDVTGIAPITGRTVVYVVEDLLANTPQCLGQQTCAGELHIYDTSTKAATATQIDVAGRAVDVKFVP